MARPARLEGIPSTQRQHQSKSPRMSGGFCLRFFLVLFNPLPIRVLFQWCSSDLHLRVALPQ